MPGKFRGEHSLLSVFQVLSLKWIRSNLRSATPILQWPGSYKVHAESYGQIIIKISTNFYFKKMILM